MRKRINLSDLHETGRFHGAAGSFVQFVSGGSGEGYWTTNEGSRLVIQTSGTTASLRVYSTEDPTVGVFTNTLTPILVNGEPIAGGLATLGDQVIKPVHLGSFPGSSPISKRVEFITPIQNAVAFNGTPQGVFMMELDVDGDFTIIPPVTTGAVWVFMVDSIGSGMGARSYFDGMIGRLKLGSSDPFHRMYAGNYNAGTTYAPKVGAGNIGQIVAYNSFTWEKTSSAAAGTTPAIGADWRRRGFIGRVVMIGAGLARIFDDVFDSTSATAFATYLATIPGIGNAGSRIGWLRMVNDHYQGTISPGSAPSVATIQTVMTQHLNALSSVLPTTPVTLYGIGLTPAQEAANGLGETLDQMRSAFSNAVGATGHGHANYVNLKSLITSTDSADLTHPTTHGHSLLNEGL